MVRRTLLVLLILMTAVTPPLARACLTSCTAEHVGMSTPQPDCHDEAPAPMPDDDERSNAAMTAACAFGAVAAPPAPAAPPSAATLTGSIPVLVAPLISLSDTPPGEPPRPHSA